MEEKEKKKSLAQRVLFVFAAFVLVILTSINIASAGDGKFIPLKGEFKYPPVYWSENEVFFAGGDLINPIRDEWVAKRDKDMKTQLLLGTFNSKETPPEGKWIIETAKIYNIETRKFRDLGVAINIKRRSYSAIKLKDGRVLIVGGYTEGPKTEELAKTAEIYDPKTNKFTLVSSNFGSAYSSPTCVLLNDDRVFVLHTGMANGSRIEIFDPKINMFKIVGKKERFAVTPTFTPRGSEIKKVMQDKYTINGYNQVNAVLLDDGRVLIVGTNRDRTPENVEVFNPKADTFESIGSNLYQLTNRTLTKLKDGRVLLAGGADWMFAEDAKKKMQNYPQDFKDAEIFDPKTNAFSHTGNLKQKGGGLGAILLSNGKVLVGIKDQSKQYGQTNFELYDPQKGTFKSLKSFAEIAFNKIDIVDMGKNRILIMDNNNIHHVYKY